MSEYEYITTAETLIKTLRTPLTPLAAQIADRGYSEAAVQARSGEERAQAQYMNLCAPCHRFVRDLAKHMTLDALASHARLAMSPLGARWSYIVPRVPDPRAQWPGVAWQLTEALCEPQGFADARLLLWLAVCFNPPDFGQDWLFHQRVMQLLPPAREESGPRPMNRAARWVRMGAEAILRAIDIESDE